jgi:RHH-type transcriptional regulator, rel operon repressor / antitoxin RelB
MLALRLPKDIEDRLDQLARRTGRTKSFYAREAIIEKIEDLEDYYVALERTRHPMPGVPLDDVLREFGMLGEPESKPGTGRTPRKSGGKAVAKKAAA